MLGSVKTRWLSLFPALERTIEMFYGLKSYVGYPESDLRFGIKKPHVKRNIIYYLNLKATILNYFST
jgi:hypothetical protein